ncbi:alpha/beta fold hydrolase [Nocardia cyriacigeorgica]|uniref:alpha/beta fold hydrolase n=1 Tax=Nocardia cyriacigeorgica TaxID=135487 RepID=UPI00245694A2|nr:alpha/beta hydrolase [Nocardia cyriacigeorgica]
MSDPIIRRFGFDAVEIEALTWGDPGDPAAILVHGFPDSAWTWDVVGPALAAEGRYVVAPFTRGYAPSSLARDDDYSLGSLVADIVDLHGAIGADSRTILVGNDWGGAIASATSSSHPELFERVVLIAIPPLPTIVNLFRPARLPANLPTLLRQAPRSWYMTVVSTPWLSERIGRRLVTTLWRLWAPGADVVEYQRRGLEALGSRERLRAAFSYYRAVWNPWYRRTRAHRKEQRFAFDSPRNPTLFLQGAADTCGLERTGARALEDLPPGSRRVVVPGAGHFAHLEQPSEITRHILSYLTEGAGR